MTDKLSKKKNHLEYNLSAEPEDILHINPPVLIITDTENGDNGDGGVGTSTLSVKELAAYQQAAYNMDRRQRSDGQKKFASCPYSENPNNLLGKKNLGSSCDSNSLLKKHPKISESQQFSGISPELSPDPKQNSEAENQFQQKLLENRLQLQKKFGSGASKKFSP